MRSVRVARGALLLLLAAAPLAGAEEAQSGALPSAESVLDRFVEVTGGEAAYTAIRNRISRGKLSMPAMSLEGTVEIWQMEGDKFYMEIELPGMGPIRQGSDGDTVWESSAMMGPRVLQGAEREVQMRTAAFHSEAKWREVYPEVSVTGIEEVDGRPAYAVLMKPVSGAPLTTLYDVETGLAMQMRMIIETQMGDIPTLIAMGDYREVDGVRLPFSAAQSVGPIQQVFTMEAIEHNVEITEDRFAPPPEIQALLDKKSTASESAAPAPK